MRSCDEMILYVYFFYAIRCKHKFVSLSALFYYAHPSVECEPSTSLPRNTLKKKTTRLDTSVSGSALGTEASCVLHRYMTYLTKTATMTTRVN